MKKDRKHLRRRTSDYYLVTDCASNAIVGRVGNLSLGGIMVISTDSIEVGKFCKLRLGLPEKVGGLDSLEFEAECRWSTHNEMAEWWENGFEFRSLPEGCLAMLEQLIHSALIAESERLNMKKSDWKPTPPRIQHIRSK